MNPEQTINLNSAQCIKTISYFGHDVYRNICANTAVDVPWGTADWGLAIFSIIAAVVVIGMFAVMAFKIAMDR